MSQLPVSEKSVYAKPGTIAAFCMLLALFALFPDANTIAEIFQIQTLAGLWSWLAELALISLGLGLAITASVAIWKQLKWGLWLAGIYLVFRLIGSFIAIIAILSSTSDGTRLYQSAPELLYQPATIFVVSVSMLTFLYLKVKTQ